MITRTIKYTASDGTEHDSPQAAAQKDLQNYLCRLIEHCWPGIDGLYLDKLSADMARNPEALRDALDTYLEDLEAHPDVKPTMVLADYDRFVEIPREEFERWTKPERLRATDNRICATCDGGPGNDGVCLCGEERWVEPDPKGDHEEPPHPSGLVLTDRAKTVASYAKGHTVYDWLAAGWTREQLLDHGMAVEVTGTVGDPLDPDRIDVTVDDTTRGFEFDLATGSSQSFEIKADGTFTTDTEGMFYATERDLEREGKAVGEMLRKSNPRVVYKPAPLGDPDDPSTWAVDHPQYCRPFGTRED